MQAMTMDFFILFFCFGFHLFPYCQLHFHFIFVKLLAFSLDFHFQSSHHLQSSVLRFSYFLPFLPFLPFVLFLLFTPFLLFILFILFLLLIPFFHLIHIFFPPSILFLLYFPYFSLILHPILY
jgi:hypothetical protein